MILFLTFQLILIFCFNFLNDFSFRRCIRTPVRPVDHLWWSNFTKIVNNFWPLTMFVEEIHRGI